MANNCMVGIQIITATEANGEKLHDILTGVKILADKKREGIFIGCKSQFPAGAMSGCGSCRERMRKTCRTFVRTRQKTGLKFAFLSISHAEERVAAANCCKVAHFFCHFRTVFYLIALVAARKKPPISHLANVQALQLTKYDCLHLIILEMN
mgnify:CR=1 FL=1